MAHDASNNNPAKEALTALVGITLLLVMIAAIAISAWLRPAGEHQPQTPAIEQVATNDKAVAQSNESSQVQSGDATPSAEQDKADKVVGDAPSANASSTPSDATNAEPISESTQSK